MPRKLFSFPPLLALTGLAAVIITVAAALLLTRRTSDIPPPHVLYRPRPAGTLTFNQHIAPIIYQHCSGCHRPGRSAPFQLLTYEDCAKRARQIVEVTGTGFMPPWLPEPGPHRFAGERRLSTDEIGQIAQWAAEGCLEGAPADLPPLPAQAADWELGTPDLVVAFPSPYKLAAGGGDVYRNFVLSLPTTNRHYVRAVEFRPGATKAIHHAVLFVDRTPASRTLDTQDPEPGFGGGMTLGSAQIPDGHFIGWTPGKQPFAGYPDMAWELSPGTDLVLQLHLRPTGKEEPIQPEIGLFFTDTPPTQTPYALVIRSKFIDIPPGAKNHVVAAEYELPVGVRVLAVYPHAHYLGKELLAVARLPTGKEEPLIHIRNWDFNWQDDYRYLHPPFLPQGTVLQLRYTYDNSKDNPRNPNNPPRHVRYGQNSDDEMAELMLQVLPEGPEELALLRRYSAWRAIVEDIQLTQARLRDAPGSAEDHLHLARRFGQIQEWDEAVEQLRRAAALAPASGEVHYLLGDALAQSGRMQEALEAFQTANRLTPDHPAVLSALAQILATHPEPGRRDPGKAVELAARAVELTERQDPLILEALARAYAAAGKTVQAIEAAQAAVESAVNAGNSTLAQEIEKRLERFKAVTGP